MDIQKITKSAIREIPKSWQMLFKNYLTPLSRKDIFYVNGLAIVVGVLTGYSSIGFRYLIGLLQNSILYHRFDWHLVSPLNHTRGYLMLLIVPVGFLISTLITHFFAKEAKGHGVPEVIEAVMIKNGYMRKRLVAFKALASSITIASGGSVGREGPIVQIGSAIGSSVGQLLALNPKLVKTLVGCGAAGAIAATFNTPIAGVIFAIEIIVLELKTKSFVPLVISAVFATMLSRYYLGNEPTFIVPHTVLTTPNELVFYLVLGVLAGVFGTFFIRLIYGFEDFFDNFKIPFWVKPLVGGLIIGGLGLYYPQIYGVGYESVTEALQQKSAFSLMLLLIGLKMFATSITLASGGSGGVFAPSLFIGAMLGGAYGFVVHQFFPEMTAEYGAYALVGMAAMFSATARATFTAIVILFEMTLNYSIILPLMLACVLADQVSSILFRDSVYSLKLRRKGIKFVSDISVNILSITAVKEIMTNEIHFAEENMNLKEALDKLSEYGHSVHPIVDENQKLIGKVTHLLLEKEFLKAPEKLIKDICSPVEAVVDAQDSALNALSKIEKMRDPRVWVIEQNTKKLVGVVCPVDFVRLSLKDID